jgi:hypothetical protein
MDEKFKEEIKEEEINQKLKEDIEIEEELEQLRNIITTYIIQEKESEYLNGLVQKEIIKMKTN